MSCLRRGLLRSFLLWDGLLRILVLLFLFLLECFAGICFFTMGIISGLYFSSDVLVPASDSILLRVLFLFLVVLFSDLRYVFLSPFVL